MPGTAPDREEEQEAVPDTQEGTGHITLCCQQVTVYSLEEYVLA